MKSKLALTSFILSLLALIMWFVANVGLIDFIGSIDEKGPLYLGILFILALAGFVTGIFALVQIKKNAKPEGKTFAIFGIIIPIILALVYLGFSLTVNA